MDKQRRRDIAREYKERKVPVGIFSLRCEPTGEAWIGMSRNLDGAANSALMSLRLGSHRNATLQAAWKAHGQAAFVYAVVEGLEEDLTPIGREDWLKARLRHWIAALEARPIVA
ncbi:GIY-YIG nuclease family protein [Phenylobacterium ferrooxidans]|uniref:GIY-YIG nuclease family protein n=1 Tax=Phenylobacterium ferrooxidans TaxID=2982689 RepID=A0ABW6CVJ4_9CAUL